MRGSRPYPHIVRWLSWLVILTLLLPATGGSAYAQEETPSSSAAEQEEQGPIYALPLGQVVPLSLAAGEVVRFELEIPQDGTYYLFLFESDGGPIQMTLEDPDGQVLIEGSPDQIEGKELELQAGSYLLTISAEEEGILTFAWIGMIGSMTPGREEPGTLYLGSQVSIAKVGAGHHALLEIPQSEDLQTILIFIIPRAPSQALWLEVMSEDGETTYEEANNRHDPEDSVIGTFWTKGGRFLIRVTPTFGETKTGATIFVLIGLPPDIYTVGDTIEETLSAGDDRQLYVLELDTFYKSVTVTLTWEDPEVDLDLTVADALVEPMVSERSIAWEGTSEEVTLGPLLPGRYLIVVERTSEPAEVGFAVEISGEPGELPAELALDEPFEGELEEEAVRYFQFEGQASHLYQITVEGDPEARAGLGVGLHPRDLSLVLPNIFVGDKLPRRYRFVAPADALYYIELTNLGPAADFQITVEDLGLPPALLPNDVVQGRVQDGETVHFHLPVEAPGRFLSVFLIGPEGVELTLQLVLLDERGRDVVREISNKADSAYQMVSLPQAPVGDYVVTVTPYEALGKPVEVADFTLITQLEEPQELVQASLEITNEGDFDVCQVTATPLGVGIEAEPIELLEEPLAPGETITVTLPAGHYDLADYDCEDTQLDELEDVVIQGAMMLAVP